MKHLPTLKELIEALQIFAHYGNLDYPTVCEHDTMFVMVSPSIVSPEDTLRLSALGFEASFEEDNFYSYVYGSA